MPPGEIYARWTSTRPPGGCSRTACRSASASTAPRTIRPSGPGFDQLRAERGSSAAARLARRGDRPDVPGAARRSLHEDDLVYCQLLCDMAGSAIENAKLYGELQSTLTQYRSLIERLPAVTYLDDLETGRDAIREPPDHRAVRNHPGRVEGQPRRMAEGRPSRRPRAGRAPRSTRRWRRASRSTPSTASSRPTAVVRWVVDRTVILPRVDGQPALTQGMIFDITDRKRAEQELDHRANHDPLTGLPNRDQFRAALDEAIAPGARRTRASWP